MKKHDHDRSPDTDWFIALAGLLGDLVRVVLLILGAMAAALVIGILIGYIHYALH